ncbi:MAG: TRAP transporter large permease [Lysobacterales bacterium]|nr:MAG: TRAP transporter large permease [Xanthomonadales bacterium]
MAIPLLLVFFALAAIGVPIAFAIAGAAIFVIWENGFPLLIIGQRVASGVLSFPLLAVPMFVLAGTLMNEAGISTRLFAFASALIGKRRGGLAQVNVLASVFLAGLSGSSLADCASTTRVLVPEMIRRGYPPGFSVCVTASSALLGPIIPPSIVMVIYGWQAEVSIGGLFVAGILPGLLIAGCLMGTVWVMSRILALPEGQEFSLAVLGHEFIRSFWALLLPVIIILGFRFGVVTPTEIGAIAVAYTLFIGFVVYRSLDWRALPRILATSARDTGAILMIIAASALFGWTLTIARVPQLLLELIIGISNDPTIVLLIIVGLLIVIGMFMEGTAVLIIMVPILLPLLKALNINLIHFGIVMIVSILIAEVTPPVGLMMYTACGISRTPIGVFVRAIWPFLIALLLALGLLTFIPEISLLLPQLFGFK